MKLGLSVFTGLLLIYGIFEIKSMMEDKKTVHLMDKAFNPSNTSKSKGERKATILIKKDEKNVDI